MRTIIKQLARTIDEKKVLLSKTTQRLNDLKQAEKEFDAKHPETLYY